MGTSLQESLYLAVKEQCFLQIVPETKLVTKRYSRARGTDSPPRHCMARLLQKVLKVQVAGWFLVVNGVKSLVVGSWSGWNINL